MKGKPFERYLQEALRELEKDEDFDPKRCDMLLTKYCNALLEEQIEKSNDKDVEGNSVNSGNKPFRKGSLSFRNSVVSEADYVQKAYGKTLKDTLSNRVGFGICLPVSPFSSVGSHNAPPCQLPEGRRSPYGEKDGGHRAGNSRLQNSFEKEPLKSSASGKLQANAPESGIANNKVFSEKPEELFTVAKVVIDNTTGKTVRVKAETPEKALAEALSKLTPGVKTTVWEEE